MSHRHARLTVHGRRLLVERVRTGRPDAVRLMDRRAGPGRGRGRIGSGGPGPARLVAPSPYARTRVRKAVPGREH
nr:leucine zipper domain-containing protein [Streptomyces leeuwenhoekii]